jgi:hypothetical protein
MPLAWNSAPLRQAHPVRAATAPSPRNVRYPSLSADCDEIPDTGRRTTDERNTDHGAGQQARPYRSPLPAGLHSVEHPP